MQNYQVQQNKKSNILIIDNDSFARKSIKSYLESLNYNVYEACNSYIGIEYYHQYKPKMLIIDLMSPDLAGIDIMKHILHIDAELPIIVVSGNVDGDTIIETLKLGVVDFIKKPIRDLSLLGEGVLKCLNRVQTQDESRRYCQQLESEVHAKTTSLQAQLSERRKVDRALRRSEQRLKSVIENATDIICTLSPDGRIVSINKAFTVLTNWLNSRWLNQTLVSLLHGSDQQDITLELQLAFSGGECSGKECRILKHNGDYLIGELIASPLIERDEVVGVLTIIRDITERKQAERDKQQLQMELLQAQKLESIGRLAGGIAHDFNNALTAILGFSDLALSELHRSHPVREYLEVVKDAGEKAATLTKQLLAFSRKQILTVEHVCLNTIVTRMCRMLQRLIGDDVLLNITTNAKQSVVLGDRAQLEQVLMNLVINARDAMPSGGELNIITENKTLTNNMVNKESINPGEYIILQVEDTGVGMTSDVQTKIFEPFYTTKSPGKGTGLGLATVFGTLRQHKGFITTNSKMNKGTIFRAYIPLLPQIVNTHHDKPQTGMIAGGDETILVVDDEPAIRRLLVNVLKRLGYHLLQAGSGEEAMEIANNEVVDLLLTDMVMPGINGKELSEKISKLYPDCEVIYMSGYAESTIDQSVAQEIKPRFIQKPVQPEQIAKKIRELLDIVNSKS